MNQYLYQYINIIYKEYDQKHYIDQFNYFKIEKTAMIGLTAEEIRQVKQQYLRQNIPEQQYQDFGLFCEQEAGKIDIDAWSPKYIEQLVHKFKEERQMQFNNPGQRSFVKYQTSNSDDVIKIYDEIHKQRNGNTESILQQLYSQQSTSKHQPSIVHENNKFKKQALPTKQVHINKQIQPVKQQKKPKSVPKKVERAKPKANERSAVDLLDSVFQQSNSPNNLPAKNALRNIAPKQTNQKLPKSLETISQSHFKTQPVSSPFFDSVNFWAIPNGNPNVPISNSKNDETNIDKFSQSSSSFGYLQYDPFGDFFNQTKNNNNAVKTNNSSPASPTRDDGDQTVKIPQTSRTTLNLEENQNRYINQKKTSPYLKKGVPATDQTLISQGKTNNEENCKSKGQIRIKEIININQQQPSIFQSKKKKKIPYEGPKVLKQEFQDQIKCFKSSIRNTLTDSELVVVIHKHQIIERSFFMPDYVMYTLRVLPVDIQCKRNYQDFTKLRSSLERVYPGVHLPYLQKNSWLSETNAECIKKQKNMLQFFLADIISNKELRNCRIFEDFLTLKEHKKMKRKFQEYDKMDKLVGLEELCLLEGKVDVKLKQEQRIYQQKLSRYLEKMQQFMDRHKRLSQSLASQYERINQTILQLSSLMITINKQTKDFNSRVSIHQIGTLEEAYEILQNSYRQSHLQNKFQLDLLQKKIIPFLHYERQNLQPLKQLVAQRNFMTKRYLKRLQTEQPPASSLPYDSEKMKVYKTGILEESKNMHIFKYQTAFINNQVCTQSKRVFEMTGIKLKKQWDYIAKKHMDRIIQSTNFWKQIRGIAQ